MTRSSSVIRVWERSPFSTSAASSSVIARSRASSIRCSSMSGGSSTDHTRKSPPESSSTVACRAAPGVFLYAASSASSSARTRTSSSIPFSRSICLTASRISLLIWLPPLLDQVPAHDRLVRNSESFVANFDGGRILTGLDHLTAEALAPGDLHVCPHGDGASHRTGEVIARAQGPLEAGRGHLERIAVEIAPQRVRHALAERVVDPTRVVDVDAEPLGPHELDGEHVDVGHPALDGLCDLAMKLSFLFVNLRHSFCPYSQKMGAKRPFLQLGKCGVQTG